MLIDLHISQMIRGGREIKKGLPKRRKMSDIPRLETALAAALQVFVINIAERRSVKMDPFQVPKPNICAVGITLMAVNKNTIPRLQRLFLFIILDYS